MKGVGTKCGARGPVRRPEWPEQSERGEERKEARSEGAMGLRGLSYWRVLSRGET